MMSSWGEEEARDDEPQLPWDPFWEFVLGDGTDDEEEAVPSRKGFAPWRHRYVEDDERSWDDGGCANSYSFGTMFSPPVEQKKDPKPRRLGWPIKKGLSGESGKEQKQGSIGPNASDSTQREQKSVTKAESEESLDIWELDLAPFIGGSNEEGKQNEVSHIKKNSRRFRTKETRPTEEASSKRVKRRFFAFGRRRSEHSSATTIPKKERSQVERSRRSLFSRSKSTPSTNAASAAVPKTKKAFMKQKPKSDQSIGTLSPELASSIGVGLETLSNSGSKLLEWMDDEATDESMESAPAVVAPANENRDTPKDTATKNEPDDGGTLSNSFNAILHWMEGSETDNSSVGASTLDDSKGTHSTDVLTSSDGANEKEREDNQSIQLSSHLFDDESASATDQEPSLPEDSLDTDEFTNEESLEEMSSASDKGVHIFDEDESSAELGSGNVESPSTNLGSRNIGNDNESAFSPAPPREAATQNVKPNPGILRTPAPISPPHGVVKPIPILARQLTHSFSEQNSIIEEVDNAPRAILKSSSRQHGSRSTFSRIKTCLPARTLTPQQKYMSTTKGLLYHELSTQELTELFPKVRSIGDEDSSAASSFFADQAEFDQSKPAHLQAPIPKKGPQSLYEYEYETGVHMFASYSELGSERTCPMTVSIGRVPLPSPISRKSKEKDVIIQVEASTVSQTDCSIRCGEWWGSDSISLPNSPGVDVVGRIYCLDPETKRRTGFMKGERVMSLVQWGGNARYLPLDAAKLVKVPEYVDPAMAVCLAETYLTAFQVLHINTPNDERYGVLPLIENRILIIGKAITNLGRAISELGKMAGGKVFALAKERHFEKVSSIGIRPRDVDSLDWWDELCGKIDTIVCIDEDVPTIYYKLLKKLGRVVMIRSPANSNIRTGPSKSKSKKKNERKLKRQPQQELPDTTKIYDVYTEWKTNLDQCKADLNHLIDKLVEKDIQPQVLDRIPLGRVGQAQQLIKGRSIKGYIVCEPWLVAKSRAIVL